MSRGATVKVKCKNCKTEFEARVADRNRGWGRYCSKSCKAIKQEQRTGQHAAYLQGRGSSHLGTGPMAREREDEIDCEGQGWDAHKIWSDRDD
jgi:hypothetical protein